VTTFLAKPRHRQVRWRVIDADGKVLGRLASRAARALMGKDSADWTPHADHREGLIIINAEKIRLTGQKLDTKLYRHYTGFPGGLRETTARNILEKKPERLLAEAIRGMLPKTRLGDRLAARLRIYVGGDYPHQAQRPEALDLAHV
jgi:large subunit ribosomal protein L13